MIRFPEEKKLIEAINNREVCLLLGAGFTYGLKNISGEKFKSADELKIKIQHTLFNHWQETDKIQFDTLDKIISEAIKEQKKNELNNLLTNELTINKDDLDSVYKLLSIPKWCRVYTLNADNTLDIIFQNNILPLKNYKFPDSLSFHDKPIVNETQAIYLHGKLPCDIEHELVFSFDSYLKESLRNNNDLYSFFLKDFFTKPFIIIGVSFKDTDFHTYALKEKDKLKIDFAQSQFSYLIDIYDSSAKDNELKRDFNITHLPKTTTKDFLGWINEKKKYFTPQIDVSAAFRNRYQRINLNDYKQFELSFLRKEYIEEENVFQKLCFDILRSYQNEIYPLRKNYTLSFSSASERDTGIDFIATNKRNSKEVVFIKCITTDEINFDRNIESEISHLLDNELPNEIKKTNSLWRQEKIISKYLICFSSEITDKNIIEQCRKLFQDFFTKYSNDKELNHLSNIEVVVMFWNDLRLILDNDPYLYHKWIGKEPQYLKLISNADRARQKNKVVNEFRDYLQDTFLPYFSRDKFKYSLSSQEQEDFINEHGLINIVKRNSNTGIIIYGQGGIGKTRLMYELGYRLLLERYSVIEVNKKFSDINILDEFLDPIGKYILLFDYIEEQKIFHKIVEWIHNNNHTNIKFIANCRKSYIGDVEHLTRYNAKLIDVGIKKPLEKKYKEAIIKFIIQSISDFNLKKKLNENQDILSFLYERPSFAVFIKYLHQKNPNSSFDLKSEMDFNNWLLTRLKLTLNISELTNREFTRDKKYIFELFSSLRAYEESTLKLMRDFSHDISALIDDGWIDEDEDTNLTVVHDTVSDTLLSYYFNKTLSQSLNQIFIEEFLEFATKYNTLPSVIRSFERLYDDDEFRNTKKEFIQTRLKSFIEKQFDKELDSYTAYTLVSYWLRSGNKPELVKPRIAEILNAGISPTACSVIIGYWLEAGDEPLLVKPFIEKCLNSNIRPKSASYIISYWLKKGDDPNILNNAVIKYLSIERNPKSSGSLIKEFIKNGGELNIIKEKTIEWLQDNKQNSLSISIVGFWLARLPEDWKDNDSLNLLREFVINILNNFGSVIITGSVISNWIVKGGELILLKPFLKNWLSKFIDEPNAQFVISWWMQKGGFPGTIKEFIKPWLNAFGNTMEGSKLMFTWLNYGYDPNFIGDYMKPFLKIYNDSFESIYLIIESLKLNMSPDYVKDAIIPWLIIYKEKRESIYLVGTWLKYGNDIRLVQDYIQNGSLNNFIDKEVNCNQVLENWLKSGGSPDIIKEFLVKYLNTFWKNQNALYLIRHWVNATNSDGLVKEFMLKIINLRRLKKHSNPFVKESFLSLKIFSFFSFIPFFKTKARRKIFKKEFRKITYQIERHLQEGLNPNLIKTEFIQYLSIAGDSLESKIVLRKWLEYANDFKFIKKYLIDMLRKTGLNEKDGSFLIGDGLLSCLEGFNLCEQPAINWLKLHKDSEDSFFVLSSYLKGIAKFNITTEKIKNIEEYIVPCLNKYYKPKPKDDSWKWRQNILIKYSNGWEPQ